MLMQVDSGKRTEFNFQIDRIRRTCKALVGRSPGIGELLGALACIGICIL